MKPFARFLTIAHVARTWRLPHAQAEAIVREQTRHAQSGRSWTVVLLAAVYLCGFCLAFVLPVFTHGWTQLNIRLAGFMCMGIGLCLPRILAHDAIVAAARRVQNMPSAHTRRLAEAFDPAARASGADQHL